MSQTRTPWWPLAVAVVLPLTLVVPARGQGQPAESKRLVPVIVVDSLDKNIGKSVTRDGEVVKLALEDGFRGARDRLATPVVLTDRVTPTVVLDSIDRLPVAPTDTLLFYFSGHGAWDPERGQYIQLYSPDQRGDSRLFRSAIVDRLKAKKPRLVVCLTDCCNVVSERRGPVTRDLQAPAQWETLRQLLLRPQGVVDMTSSAKGEYSFAGGEDANGNALPSLFTVNFMALFRAELKPGRSLTWADAHEILKEETQKDYSNIREEFLEFYNAQPAAQKEKLKSTADMFRRQLRQTVTVSSHDLPPR